MIELKELSFGSYFHPTYAAPGGGRMLDEKVFYRVDMLTSLPPTVAYIPYNAKKALPFTIDQIEPVQLSDDTLERCGFELLGEYWRHKGQPFTIHPNRTTFGGSIIKHCEWLHQLQRAWEVVIGHTLPFTPPAPVRQMH